MTDYAPSRNDRFSFGLWTVGWAARDMFPSQATALGNTFLHLGMDTDKENLKEGEETFANRPRTKPRIR